MHAIMVIYMVWSSFWMGSLTVVLSSIAQRVIRMPWKNQESFVSDSA